MNALVIKNGRVIDPASGHDGIADVWIEDGVIRGVGQNLPPPNAEEFDATGLIVAPGFIDMHVHLREPGFEHAETIESRLARRGRWRVHIHLPDAQHVAGERQRHGDQLHHRKGAAARGGERVAHRRDHQRAALARSWPRSAP